MLEGRAEKGAGEKREEATQHVYAKIKHKRNPPPHRYDNTSVFSPFFSPSFSPLKFHGEIILLYTLIVFFLKFLDVVSVQKRPSCVVVLPLSDYQEGKKDS